MCVKDLTKRLAVRIAGVLAIALAISSDHATANEYDSLLGDWMDQATNVEPVERGVLLVDSKAPADDNDSLLASSDSGPAASQSEQTLTSQPLKYDQAGTSVVQTVVQQPKPFISPVVDVCSGDRCGAQSGCGCAVKAAASACDDCSACDSCPRCESPCYPMPKATCQLFKVKSCLKCNTCGILLTPVHCKTGTKQKILGESDCRPHTPPCLPTSSFLQYFRSKPAYTTVWNGYAEETRSRLRNTDPHLHGYHAQKLCDDRCECGLLLDGNCGCNTCETGGCQSCDSGTCSTGECGCSTCN